MLLRIAIAARYAQSAYATDLDGDGGADVLSASEGDDRIAWYENQSECVILAPDVFLGTGGTGTTVAPADTGDTSDMGAMPGAAQPGP